MKKGFTLVELLVMMVVLGVIGAIAIPNISGILVDNRVNVALEDANKMYETVKVKEGTNKIKRPTTLGGCVLVTLKYLDTEGNYTITANNGSYDKDESFILIRKSKAIASGEYTKVSYDYYVRLVEKTESKKYGIELAEIKNISKADYTTNEIESVNPESMESINLLLENDKKCNSFTLIR